MKDDYYWFWINNITGIANIKLRYLFKVFDTPEDIYKASDKMFEGVMGIKPDDIYSIKESRKSEYIYREYSELDKKNIKFTYPGKYNYPERLMNIYDYPYIIYYKGRLPQSDVPSVAIVGARNCTEYGRSVAGRFAEDFADMGIQVISGMALGIDAAAQKGAVRKGGYSMAVLGCGVDICYPRTNIELYTQLESNGGIISEYSPGTPPKAGLFPMRNRIISAMSDALIVEEALSEGCLKLLIEGAQLITSSKDIYATESINRYINCSKKDDNCMNSLNNNGIFEEKFKKSGLASPKNMVYSQINLFPVSLEMIVNNSGLNLVEAEGILLELELDGLIEEVSKNYYIRKHI